MRVYRLDYWEGDGSLVEWFTHRRDAVARRRELGKTTRDTLLSPVDLPRDAAGMVRWLNANLGSDNG